MRKYKYLTFKIIVPTVLIILIVVFLCLYFIGGLKASAVTFDNEEFDSSLEGYIDFFPKSTADKSEFTTKVVAKNNKYVMVFDEGTTIVSIYANDADFDENNLANSNLLYSTANAAEDNTKSNFILTYVDSNGKLGELDSYSKSVQYNNITTGVYERHYKVKYDPEENTVDVYYEIGEFAPYVFPQQYNYNDFSEDFIGNTMFFMSKDSHDNLDYVETQILDENGDPITLVQQTTSGAEKETTKAYGLKVSQLLVLDKEVAKYILQNHLGRLYNVRTSVNGIGTSISSEYTELTPEVEEFIDSVKGYYLFDELYDENGIFKLKVGVNYNCSDSPIQINTFTFFQLIYKSIFLQYETKVEIDADNNINKKWPDDIYTFGDYNDAYLKLAGTGGLSQPQKIGFYNNLYVGNFTVEEDGTYTYDPHPYYDDLNGDTPLKGFPVYFDYNNDGIYSADEAFNYGGFPLKDEDGNYVYEYDEDGNILRCKQAALTTEKAVAQNDNYGKYENSKNIIYKLNMRFTLTTDGLDVEVLHNSIDESGSIGTKMYALEICKYMTNVKYATGKEKAGQIIIPDGSGAILSFNSPKGEQYASKYPEKRVYGNDSAINISERRASTETIMLGMYGFIQSEEGKAVLCVADKAAAQMSINADIQRSATTYNYAYFKTYLREIEKVQITSQNTYVKSTDQIYQGDIKLKYYILTGDGITYNTIASKYRSYLLDNYALQLNDETTECNPTITFLGAYEKKTLKAGVVKLREFSITSFDQALEIVRELRSRGISHMNISYRSWTEDNADQKTTTTADANDVLGNEKGLKNLSKYLKEYGIDFFPEYKVVVGKGYDLLFGGLKYSSKSISGSYSNALTYVLSTGLENKTSRRGQYVSPIYYNDLVSKFLKSYRKLDINGIYLSDIGNVNIADYSKNVQQYADGGKLLQRQTLETVKELGQKVMLQSPYDYAFEYVDVATVVPVVATLYDIVDYSIPLYQLIVSGIFDYSYRPLNYNNDYSLTWNLLKAIETGSNPAFVLANDDTNVLLDTEYTEYYNSYYVNWKDKISYLVDTLNELGIYQSRLVKHEFLTDNVVKVTYNNGLTIVINYDNENYYDYSKGLVVRSNWFAVLSKGGN